MPKVKTNSGAKKRFRFTGTGKIKRHHAYHSHILTKKKNRHASMPNPSNQIAVEDIKKVQDVIARENKHSDKYQETQYIENR